MCFFFQVADCFVSFFFFFIVRAGGRGEGKRLASENYWNSKVLKIFMVFLVYSKKEKNYFEKNYT